MLKANIVAEQRQNATLLRTNASSLGTAGAHYQREGLSLSGYHSRGVLRSGFSFVNGTRSFERQTLLQRVTSEDSGGSAVWKRSSRKLNLILGTDAHRTGGISPRYGRQHRVCAPAGWKVVAARLVCPD